MKPVVSVFCNYGPFKEGGLYDLGSEGTDWVRLKNKGQWYYVFKEIVNFTPKIPEEYEEEEDYFEEDFIFNS
jgi:hypothetical protein